MPDFIIKTHQKNAIYNQPHLFILNKGLNSGKPQKEPFTNSFVVIFQHEKDCINNLLREIYTISQIVDRSVIHRLEQNFKIHMGVILLDE